MSQAKLIIAITSLLSLSACGQSSNSDTPTAVDEKQNSANSITTKVAEAGKEAWKNTKQTASEVGSAVKEKTTEVVSGVTEKSADVYEETKQKAGEMYDTTKEKGAEVIDSMKSD